MKTSHQMAMYRNVWRICAAAEHAFAKRGFKTTAADIIVSGRLSRRELYRRFRSVDHILARMTFAADAFDREQNPAFLGHVCPSADYMLCAMPLQDAMWRDMSGTDFQLAYAARSRRVEIGPEPVPADEAFLAWYAQTAMSG